jgi:glycosylphosphatidylinositol transamidase
LLFAAFAAINLVLPYVASMVITVMFQPTVQQYQLMQSFSLLLLGMFLSSTLNFSLALLVGLLAAPLTYLRPLPYIGTVAILSGIMLNCLTPTAVLYYGALYWKIPIGKILTEAAFGWNVWGMNTQVVVWCVWWPAWLVGSMILQGRPRE